MTLTVDISPMAINRTAMFSVVRDTLMHLHAQGLVSRVMAMGKTLDLAEVIANDFQMNGFERREAAARLNALVALPPGERPRDRYVCKPDEVVLVFDPLYLLYLKGCRRALCFVLDLTPLTRPEWHSPPVSRAYVAAFHELMRPEVRSIAISESTARDLWANLGLPRSAIDVLLLYNRFDKAQAPKRRPQKQILMVGSLETRKNVKGLIAAFGQSHLAEEGYELRIVGGSAHGEDAIRQIAGETSGVRLLGRVEDKELIEEYDRAAAFVLPSSWEGFGLPALEALARGIPLLVSDTGALPEVVGPHALQVDPCNEMAMATALRQVVQQKAPDPQAIEQWLARFSREKYMREITAIVTAARPSPLKSPADRALAGLKVKAEKALAPLSIRSRLGRKLYTKVILSRRVVMAEHGPVPGDSFSADYLYGVQHERRLRMSQTFKRLHDPRPWRWPAAVASLGYDLVELALTSTIIRAQINELLLQKLGATKHE